MVYPDLYSDEHKVLESQNIKVKSVSFTAVLTNRRLILLDSKRQTLPPQEILLATLKSVDSGENAIRDPTITLSIITTAGTSRQMILTFSKMAGGERKRESDEWVKALRQHLSQTIEHPILPDVPALDETLPEPVPDVPLPPPQQPRIEIVNAPPQKKRIEISRPMKKIIETAPPMPKPVETTTLPVGSFCNRCGSRVPPESAFCNRCGTPVVKESDLETVLRKQVIQQEGHVSPGTEQPIAPAPPEAPPVPEVPQVAVVVPPAFGPAADRKERPIEEVIQSIEPLIEDSVPRKEPAPLIPRPASPVSQEPVVSAPESPDPGQEVQWPVITPAAPPSSPVPPEAVPAIPSRIPEGTGRRGPIVAVAVAAVIIIAVVAGFFLVGNPLLLIASGEPSPTPAATAQPTMVPATTSAATTMPVPATTAEAPVTTMAPTPEPRASVPAAGVWVHVRYANQFAGSVGTPNALRDVSDTGEKFYQISTSTGTVAASIQKVDGSADPLTVEIYKDGELVTSKSTAAPKGVVELQVSLKPAATPASRTTIVPAKPAAPTTNTSVNATAGT
jgi:hypothetical protein